MVSGLSRFIEVFIDYFLILDFIISKGEKLGRWGYKVL